MLKLTRSVNGRLVSARTKEPVDFSNYAVHVEYWTKANQVKVSPTIVTAEQLVAVEDEKEVAVMRAKAGVQMTEYEEAIEIDELDPVKEPAGFQTVLDDVKMKRNVQVSAQTDGRFVFTLPEENQVVGPVHVKVKSVTGNELLNRGFSYSELKTSALNEAVEDTSAELSLTVTPHTPMGLATVPDTEPYKVKGRTIAFSDGKPIKNRVLFFYAKFADEAADAQPKVITSVQTGSDGYFSFSMPRGVVDTAFTMVAGLEGEQVALTLTDAGLLSDNQIVVVQNTDDLPELDDCSCSVPTPTLPDAEDLVNSNSYSSDLGGSCVDFTTPNRSLEEFSYYSVVRTTEPEIKRVPYKKPPLLNMSDLNPDTPVIGNGLAFDRELQKWRASQEEHVDLVVAFLSPALPDGFGQFETTNANGDLKWWPFEQNITYFLTAKSKTFPGIVHGSDLFAPLNEVLLQIKPKSFFEYFCIDVAANGHLLFYGRHPSNENETYAFWYFAASKYFEEHNRLPLNPDQLDNFIKNVLTRSGGYGPGEWWLFFMDYSSYVTPNGTNTIAYLKTELTQLFTRVNNRAPHLEAEVLEFLKLSIDYFKEDYNRIPNTPEEIFAYINSNFSDNSGQRLQLTGQHAIDWDETPTLYHNTTISHGHILHYKHIWKADGYSMGDLLYSLPLAPCQKKQIAIFDWDRKETGTRENAFRVRKAHGLHGQRPRCNRHRKHVSNRKHQRRF